LSLVTVWFWFVFVFLFELLSDSMVLVRTRKKKIDEETKKRHDTDCAYMMINFRRGRTIRGTRNWIFHKYTKPCELKGWGGP